MRLTEEQADALTEVVNIALGRAAAALSDLTGHRVLIEVPQIAVYPIPDLKAVLGTIGQQEVTTVHQIFTGAVAGDALMVLGHAGAVELVHLMTDNPAAGPRLDISDREVLTEIGNILLNACLGTFGNLLQVQLRFLVPRLHLESLDDLLASLVIETEELRYALVITAHFSLRDSAVSGHVLVILGMTPLGHLIRAIEELG
jgi:chemotaxis protein CheC